MKKLVFGLALIGISCDKSEEGGDEPVCLPGHTQCSGNQLQLCRENAWTALRDCGARCLTEGTSSSCLERDGHVPATVSSSVDTRGFPGFQRIEGRDGNEVLRFENWLGYPGALTPGASYTNVPLDEDQQSYETCGTCVRGFVGSSREFMPMGGSIDVVLGLLPGDVISVTFHNVMLQQVELGAGGVTTVIEGGERWLLDGITLTDEAGPFLCDDVDPGLDDNDSTCMPVFQNGVGTWRYECVDSNLGDTIAGELLADVDCADAGRICYIQSTGAICAQTCTTAQRNTSRCNGNAEETCNGTVWLAVETCSGTEICWDSGTSRDCYEPCATDGELRCTGTVIEACNGTVWREQQDCADAGLICDSSGAPACVVEPCATADEKRCVGNVLQNCNGATWDVQEDCGDYYTCDATAADCVASPCAAGDGERCAGNVRQTCETTSWTDSETCAEFCRSLSGSTYCTAACAQSGDERCNDPWLEQCDGTVWTRDLDCSAQTPVASCVAISATDAACQETCATVGDTRCSGTTVERCDDTFHYAARDNCSELGRNCVEASETSASCEPQSCTTPGTMRCVGDTLHQTCSGTDPGPYNWGNDVTCTDRCASYDGLTNSCVESCTGSDTRCSTDGTAIETCNGSFWGLTQRCESPAVCDATGGSPTCM